MLTGRDIILISSIDWDFNWQGHQEIANRLARAGNRVLYVENMGVRSPGLHDVGRVARRFSHWAGSVFDGGVRQVSPGLYVCSPLILPPFGSSTRGWPRLLIRKAPWYVPLLCSTRFRPMALR